MNASNVVLGHAEAHEHRLAAMSNIECSVLAVLEGDGFQITAMTVPTAVWERLVGKASVIDSVQIMGTRVTHDATLPTPRWCEE